MIIDIKGSNEIGLQFLGSVVELVLYNGFNLVIWQFVGKTEYFMERPYILKIGFARICAPSSENFTERLSIPAALSIYLYLYLLIILVQSLQ